MKVGIVGVGNMGMGLARNVLKKGNNTVKNLYLVDSNPSNVNILLGESATIYNNKIEVKSFPYKSMEVPNRLQECDIIALSLPSEEACERALFNEDNGIVLRSAKMASFVIVDHSTYSRQFVLDVQNKVERTHKDISYIDAPVSGGPKGAEAGTLSVMVGCDSKDNRLAVCKPLFDLYANNVSYFGKIGAGMAAKLINQALVGVHCQTAVEVILLGEKFGLLNDRTGIETLQNLLKASWGQSKILELILADYLIAKEKGFADPYISQSSAPLRNLDKDFGCIQKEIDEVCGGVNLSAIDAARTAIKASCSPDVGLQDAAFVSLLQLLKKNFK